jgi:hypothetical protein
MEKDEQKLTKRIFTKSNSNIIDSRISALFSEMVYKHSKVLVMKFIIRYPQDYELETQTNLLLSKFFHSLCKYYKNKSVEIKYLATREHLRSEHPHYHLAIFIDGNKIQSNYAIHTKANSIWQKLVNSERDGLISKVSTEYNSKEMVFKYEKSSDVNQQYFNFILENLKYLSKIYSKDKTPRHTNVYVCSRLKK